MPNQGDINGSPINSVEAPLPPAAGGYRLRRGPSGGQ